VKQAARAAAQAEASRLQAHAALPELLPGDAVRRQPRAARALYRAYVTRASELGQPELDNSAAMRELLALRQEEAQLLGYANFAEVSLVPKMADSPQQVLDFLRDLARRARPTPSATCRAARVRRASWACRPAAWDLAYASEKLKEARYAFSDQEVKQYFTEPRCSTACSASSRRCSSVASARQRAGVAPERALLPHRARGQLVGQFYLDPYAAPASARRLDGRRARPLARPEGWLQTPSAHHGVQLHAAARGQARAADARRGDDAVPRVRPWPASHADAGRRHRGGGISGVEWDAVSCPAVHGELLLGVGRGQAPHRPRRHGCAAAAELYDRMLRQELPERLQTLRQVEFRALRHAAARATGQRAHIQQVLDDLRREVGGSFAVPSTASSTAFSHIFAGGYAAGYYSYKWAEVLSADAWSAFEETAQDAGTVLNVETGRRYREAVLEAGGSRTAMESFKAFRGREPSIDALLRHQGMA
jgi:oligopeptidase A